MDNDVESAQKYNLWELWTVGFKRRVFWNDDEKNNVMYEFQRK